MSYCRWSSMNWRCDIYAYEHVDGGWTIHTAARRIVSPIPEEIEVDEPGWAERHMEIMNAVDNATYEDIDLPYAGVTFNEPTLREFKARLLELRGLGYVFPDYVIEAIDTEMMEEGA